MNTNKELIDKYKNEITEAVEYLISESTENELSGVLSDIKYYACEIAKIKKDMFSNNEI